MGTQSTWDFGPVFTFDSSERAERQPPQHKMAELGLKKKEIDAINFAFDVYDFMGDGKVDAFYVGDLVRLQPEPHPEDHQGDRRWSRQGREVPHQARCLPHVQGLQGLQGPGWLPRLR